MTNVHPVGARWEAHTLKGDLIGVLWLSSRRASLGRFRKFVEIWKFLVQYEDGSGLESDWGSSRRSVQEEASTKLHGMGHPKARFRRIQGERK